MIARNAVKSSNTVKEFIRIYRQTHSKQLRDEKKAYAKRWLAEHPGYRKAYSRKNYMTLYIDGKRVRIRVPKRRRPSWCELCEKQSERLDYHHWNDEKPVFGLWLCTRCHRLAEVADRTDGNSLTNKYLALKGVVEESQRWIYE